MRLSKLIYMGRRIWKYRKQWGYVMEQSTGRHRKGWKNEMGCTHKAMKMN